MKISIHALEKSQRINPMLYGVFIEDINYGCDGGLYGELVANRAFENVNHEGKDLRMQRWSAVGNTQLSIGCENPRGQVNPHYLHVQGEGVRSDGYLGQGLWAEQGESYRLHVIARACAGCVLRAALVAEDGETLSQDEITLCSDGWEKHALMLPVKASGQRAYLTLYVENAECAELDYVSLFPGTTFNGRENGLRKDIAQAIADLHPAFLRFPGGCIVEGRSFANMYRFKETLGPVEDRRTNWNRWQMGEYQIAGRSSADYFQTYGMGFYEYFLFCEDIGAKPLPILNCGLTCQWHESLTIPLDEMDDIIQDYLDLIEFANGDTNTTWGKVRADMGHPAPFGLEMIGVGNEQWNQVYFERYEVIHAAVKAVHPEIELIGCAGWTDHGDEIEAAHAWMKATPTKPDYSDEHFYKQTEWFFRNVQRYENYDAALPKVFVGEYAAHSARETGQRRNSLHTALAEAAFLTGVENTAAHVAMTCYAPLMARVGANQWQPDLIWFDQKSCCLTPNYYVQKMFADHRGDWLAKADVAEGGEDVYVTASWKEADGAVILKVVNAGDKPVEAAIALPGGMDKACVQAQVLTGECLDMENTPDAPRAIVPVEKTGAVCGGQLAWTFEARSATVVCIRGAE